MRAPRDEDTCAQVVHRAKGGKGGQGTRTPVGMAVSGGWPMPGGTRAWLPRWWSSQEVGAGAGEHGWWMHAAATLKKSGE